MYLELNEVHFSYDHQPVLRGLNLSLAQGEIACILGASGCGKSSVLRCIAGFNQIHQGSITLNGACIASMNHHLPAHQRHVGMVFQDYALFPHLTVSQNIAFGLSHLPRAEQAHRVAELLERTHLSDYAQAYPSSLSGGQQQRVALARALAPRPAMLLLDEPMSSLDTALRSRLTQEVRDMIREQGTTALWVTHDQDEAFVLADKIALMQSGQILAWDTPYALYHRPSSPQAAQMIGQSVFLLGEMLDAHTVSVADLGRFFSPRAQVSGTVAVLIRPDDVVHDDDAPIKAQILSKQFLGANFIYHLRLSDGQTVFASVPSHHDHAVGEMIGVRLDLEHVMAFAGSAA